MNFIAYLVTGLSLVATPARAADDDPAKSSPAVQSDVNRGIDANRPKAPDNHAKIERHWDPGHVEAKERRTARHDVKKKGRDETIEERRKVEKHTDGSRRSEVEKIHVYDDGSGETIDHEKMVVDSKVNDQGGRTITREVSREHDAPGSANDRTTHAKETIEKDAKGKVIKRERSE